MPIRITSGFNYSGAAPLDDRLVVATTSDRDSLVAYEGMIVYVTNEKCHYFYNNSQTWEKLQTATWNDDYLE